VMQNFPEPITWAELPPIVPVLSIELCALAMEMPALSAATAASAVNDFMLGLLEGACRKCGTARQPVRKTHVPGTRASLGKSFRMRPSRGDLSDAAAIA
jgi:hypothetical protein